MDDVFYSLIREHGYTFLFLLLLAGIVGFPIPDEGLLVIAGALVAEGTFHFMTTYLVALAAIFLGTLVNYAIANSVGVRSILRWLRRRRISAHRWKKTFRILKKYGVFALPFSFFLPGVRIGVSYGVGLLRIPLQSFVFYSLIGIVSWIAVYLYVGGLVGAALTRW